MNPSKRTITAIQDVQESQEKDFKRIIKILKKLPLKDIEILKKLIENQMDFQVKRTYGSNKRAIEYFSGQVDLWDEIFQALGELNEPS
jgi:hypothetical protein